MTLTTVPLAHEADEVDEVVPVSSWAKQGLTPMVPHSATHTHLIQFGPLTAQGNYISELDNQPVNWHPFSAEGIVPPDQFYDDVSVLQGIPFDTFAGHPTALDQWGDMNEGYADASYELYDQTPQIVDQVYHPVSPDHVYYESVSAAPFTDYVPAPNLERQTLGPWEGMWAFNPSNVADNFVYPSTEVSTAPLPATSSPSRTSGPTHISPTAAPAAIDSGSPHHPAQARAQSAEWVVATRLSPSAHSEPRHSHSHHSPAMVTDHAPSARRSSDAGHATRSLRPEKVKRNKTMQVQLLVPRRQGPLSVEQRQKADDMRYYGACWRCRRYKKPCNGPGECDTCKTSGFRVWPSTIGCYRGNMEDFIGGVMPGNAEAIMKDLRDYTKKPNWKVHFGYTPDMTALSPLAGTEDRFTKLSVKLRATRMAGQGFVDLLDILANYQRSRTKPDMCLEHVCEALSYICDVYHAFVDTDTSINLLPNELLTALTKFRSHYSANWRHFLALCLSGRRSAWFPAFLCATINVPLLVVLKDGFIAIPEPARSRLWPNISFLIEDLRNRLYPMGLDLLSALAKGIKPWKLKCWGTVPSLDPATKAPIPGRFERDPDGLRLLGGDTGAFDGFAAVQAWLARNRADMYYGVDFLTTTPFSERNAKMQPVAALAWIFDVAPPGHKVVNGRVVEGVDDSIEVGACTPLVG